MIVPTNRLLTVTALGVVPLSVLAAIVPATAGLVALALAALVLVVLIDAFRAPDQLAGLSVQAPPVVRLSKDREGVIELRLKNENARTRSLRLALALPASLTTTLDEQTLELPAQTPGVRLAWRCLPTRRGRFPVERVFLETGSPLGFWVARGPAPITLEIRVYPNLLQERNQLAALFLNRGVFGVHALRQVGKGREFEKLREYVPSDSYEDIHWKATARKARPITKVFQIEKTQEIYVILDASRLSARLAPRSFTGGEGRGAGAHGTKAPPARFSPTIPDTAIERFVTAALVLGLAAERHGDLFGLLTFSNKIENFVRAKNGRQHYQTCRDALYTLPAREVTPDFDEVAAFIRLRLRRRALLVFLTSLDDPVLAESFVRNLDLLCRQHLILVNMLKPPFADPIFSEANVATVDDVYQRLAGHLQWNNLREMERGLRRRGVQFTLINNEKLCVELVSQYLGVKQRQLL